MAGNLKTIKEAIVGRWSLPVLKTGTPWYTEKTVITPDIASAMLTHNSDNRTLSSKYTQVLVKKMRDGAFIDTHQGIAFSSDGVLIDGQHRLAAVVASGVPVTLNVTYGLPRAAFAATDVDNHRRTAADLLGIKRRDLKNTALMCAVGKMMLNGMRRENMDMRVDEISDFVSERSAIIDPFIREISPGGQIVRRAPVIGAFCAAVRTDDGWPGPKGYRDMDTTMIVAMRLGAQQWDGKHDPMKTLFKRLTTDAVSKRGTSLTPTASYSLTVSAVRAAISGKTLATIAATDIDWGDDNDRGGPLSVARRPSLRRRKKRQKQQPTAG